MKNKPEIVIVVEDAFTACEALVGLESTGIPSTQMDVRHEKTSEKVELTVRCNNQTQVSKAEKTLRDLRLEHRTGKIGFETGVNIFSLMPA